LAEIKVITKVKSDTTVFVRSTEEIGTLITKADRVLIIRNVKFVVGIKHHATGIELSRSADITKKT
jgi:hypothetical protein